jgi:LuxR family maltose regulon positive regulatory protein
LRFTPAEASDFLNQVMRLNLTEEDISALETRTEGWIAGLQLAALAMQGSEEPSNFIQAFTGSHHFILDYLIEEVLQQQPEVLQTFLLRTSILDRMCGTLCDAVLGHASISGQETLETLERVNLFIVPLDSERRWYRYHHLFGDLLRQRLGKPTEYAALNLRASQWYEENNDLGAAFHHAIAAEDFSRAVMLAEDAWERMDESFQTAAWLGWVQKLPEEVIRVSPRLCTLLGRALADKGELEASELRLQDAERILDVVAKANETQYNSLRAMIALARAGNAQVVGNLTKTVKYAELALQFIPEDDFFLRAQAEITLEFTHWTMGDLAGALMAMENWMTSMQKAGNFIFVVASAFAVADIQVEQGHLREALITYQQSIQLAAEHGKEAQLVTAHHHLGLAMLYHEMGMDEHAAKHLEKAKKIGELTTLVDWPYRWCIAQAQIKEDEGNLDAALVLLDEARRVYVRNPVPNIQPIDSLMARVYLKQGRLPMAQEWVHKRGLSVENEVSYLQEFEYLTMVRVLIAEYSHDKENKSLFEALNLLDRLLKNAESQGRMGNVLASLITQALVLQAQGNLSLALLPLERSLVLSQPEGNFRIFLNEGEPMRLLLLAFRSKIEEQSRGYNQSLHGYLKSLLTAFVRPDVMNQSSTSRQKSEMIESLSDRELEVLRLIAHGLSNREISQQLFLAMSTVKGHNLKIFTKLQAQNRTEAVVRARELGLI